MCIDPDMFAMTSKLPHSPHGSSVRCPSPTDREARKSCVISFDGTGFDSLIHIHHRMRLELAAMFVSASRAFVVPRSIPRGRSLSSLLSPRLDGLDKPTVWHEFSPLANEYNAINLGQGFPDWDPPAFVIEAMRISTSASGGRHANQYARSYAHMPLAQVLSEDYTERWGLSIDPATQVATAVGCTNALYCALQGLVSPGDEVLLLEPAFDIVRVCNGCDHTCRLGAILILCCHCIVFCTGENGGCHASVLSATTKRRGQC